MNYDFQMTEFTPRDPNFKERTRRKVDGNHFMEHIGLKVVTIEPGYVVAEMEIQTFHKQQFGRLHGGLVSVVADSIAGFASYTLVPPDKDVVTGEIKVSYFRPGQGEKLVCEGRVVKPGKMLSFAEADVYAIKEGAKIHVGRATTTMVLIDRVQYSEVEKG